jgi:hypothetical protein
MKDFAEKLDLIEKKHGTKIFKKMYKELVENIATTTAITPKYILDSIIEEMDELLD